MKKKLIFIMSFILIFSCFMKGQNPIEFKLKFINGSKTPMKTVFQLSNKDRDSLKPPTSKAFIIITDIDKSVNTNWLCNGNNGVVEENRKNIRFDVTDELRHGIPVEGEDSICLDVKKNDPKKTVYVSVIVKWEKTGSDGKKSPTANGPIIISPPYKFLPNASDYSDIYKKSINAPTVLTENEYRITYDYKNRQLDYPAAWLGGKNKKVAGLNKNIVFEVVNINPLLYNVTINNTVVNRNTELESEFLKHLTIPEKSEGSAGSAAQSFGEKSKDSLSDDQKLLQSFDTLAAELQYFYDKKIADPCPDLGLYKEELESIKEKVRNTFGIDGLVDKKSILKKGAELVAKVKGSEINKTWAAAIQNSADLMDKLDNINYTIASNAIEPGNNDEIDFSVTIKKGDNDVAPPANYSVMIAGGFKADFSIGFYLTGLIDELYALQSVPGKDTTFYQKTDSILNIQDVTKQKIIRDDKGKNYIGMMILSHFYPRTGYRVNLALTTGFGVDLGLNARYLLGGSLLLGYEKRVVITGGCIWGNTKRLASGLKNGQYYTGDSSQLQKDVLNHSWFVSISFNIGSVPLSGNSNKKQ